MQSIRTWRIVAFSSILVVAAASAVPASLTAAGGSSAAVLDWNVNATAAIVTVAKQPPAAAILSYAMVQGAVYDAVNAIDGSHQPYLAAPPADGSESKSAAAATAAHDVLVGLFPAQAATLAAELTTTLAGIPDGTPKTAGEAVGRSAAATMIAARMSDGRFGPSIAVPGSLPGQWRPAPPAFAVDPVSWVANVKPFILPRGDLFRSDGPIALTSAAYAEDYNEVKSFGSATSTTRTADETHAAIWWQDHGAALYNRILRNIASGQGLDITGAARMLAMTDLAGADSMINCWNDKYFYRFWRPVTAIRLGDTDRNPATVADPSWTPLLATPAFPRPPVGSQLRSRRHLQHAAGVLRDRQDRLLRVQQQLRDDPELLPLLAGAQGGPRRPCLGWHPLPDRRYAGLGHRPEGVALPREAFLRPGPVTHSQVQGERRS